MASLQLYGGGLFIAPYFALLGRFPALKITSLQVCFGPLEPFRVGGRLWQHVNL